MPKNAKHPAPQSKRLSTDTFDWDEDVPGLALRRRTGRQPAWYVQVWVSGRTIRRSLGPHISLNRQQARDMARALTAQEVAAWWTGLNGSTGTRNRTLAVLSGLIRHAELLGLRPPGSNPCQGLRRRKSGFQVHRLTQADYQRLGGPETGRGAMAS